MAKFLTTKGNSYFIEQLIIDAQSELVLVTPFLKLSETLFQRLTDADAEGIRMMLIYGKSELNYDEKEKLFSLENIQILFCKNLHAKCYHNGISMVISSMNLYEFSEQNNREMGIYINKEDDNEIFIEALKEIKSIKNASTLEKDFNLSINQNSISTQNQPYKIEHKSDPENDGDWDFHLPDMLKILKNRYPKKRIFINGGLYIKDFPFDGVIMVISHRIDLKFSEKLDFKWIETINSNLWEVLPNLRIFWNRYKISFYPEKDFDYEINEIGLNKIVDKQLSMIDDICQHLKVE